MRGYEFNDDDDIILHLNAYINDTKMDESARVTHLSNVMNDVKN